ncbi:MAG: hypothetical protein H0T62_11935, partial [Parachlamydiaceae bacterium]|nr:hypothetical protein [Parachlamydiaceae bacterium]
KVAADAILDDVVAIATTEERSASDATFQPTEASFQFFHSLAELTDSTLCFLACVIGECYGYQQAYDDNMQCAKLIFLTQRSSKRHKGTKIIVNEIFNITFE